MPKIVDHAERRRELGEAVWRVIGRSGIEHASVRAVAAEAGWSAGALRHYFDSQDQLVAFAMDLVAEQVRRRVGAGPPHTEWRDQVLWILDQFIPTDQEKRTENAIWFAFSARAGTDPALRKRRAAVHDELRAAIARIFADLSELGVLRAGVDPAVETDRLHALVDGLCVHALVHPKQLTAARMRAALATHIDSLTS